MSNACPQVTFPFAHFLLSEHPLRTVATRKLPLRILDNPTGELRAGDRFLARFPDHEVGLVANIGLPAPLRSALYHLEFSDFRVEGTPEQVVGHLLFSRRYTSRAVSRWAEYHSRPLVAGTPPTARTRFLFYSADPAFGHLYVEFSGFGQLSFAPSPISCLPIQKPFTRSTVARFPVDAHPDSDRVVGQVHIPRLGPGLFRVRFVLRGDAFSTFFQRQPTSILMAAYTGSLPPESQAPLLETRVQEWCQQDGEELIIRHHPAYIRPQVEVIQAPWWLAVPWIGPRRYEFDFILREPRDVWLLLRYAGELDLTVEEVVLYKQEMGSE